MLLPMTLLCMYHLFNHTEMHSALFRHIERSHDARKLFGVLLKDGKFSRDFTLQQTCLFFAAIQDEIQSIGSHQQINADDVHRQMILFSLDLLCRYLLVLEHSILNDDPHNKTPNSKKQKRSIQTSQTDWCINERDEILYLFTNLIKLDLRQFWHEKERLEDQQIGR